MGNVPARAARAPLRRKPRPKPQAISTRHYTTPAELRPAAAGMPRYLDAYGMAAGATADAPESLLSAPPPQSARAEDEVPPAPSIAERLDVGTQLPQAADLNAAPASEPVEDVPGSDGAPQPVPSHVRDRIERTVSNTGPVPTEPAAEDAPRAALTSLEPSSGGDDGGEDDAAAAAAVVPAAEREPGDVGGGNNGGEGAADDMAGDSALAEGLAASAAAGSGDNELASLGTGDIALIDTELAEHQRWGAAASRVGAAGSAARADFIVQQAGAGALGGFGHGAIMGAAIGAGSQALELGAGRLVARLAGPALARSFPLPAIGAVIGGVFSAIDLATRDWGRTGETIGRFGEGGSIYEQLANSIAAISEIIGIATAVLNVIAGVIGAISIAMWVITVLTVGVASPLAATLSTIAAAIGIGTMILDGINALVLQRLVTLFRALHTFTSQADPTDVEAQGGRIGEAAGASAGFIGGVAGGVAGAGITGAAGRRLGLDPHAPPRVPDADAPRAASGDGPTITADPPPADTALPAGDRPALLPPEPVAPRPIADGGAPAVDPHGPTMPAPEVVDPHAPTMAAPEVVDPRAPTALPEGGGMPEIPGPPRLPEFEPLPDYGPELPDWRPEPSPYAPTDVPPPLPVEPLTPSRAPTEPVTPSRAPTERAPAAETVDPHAATMPAPEVVDPRAPTALPEGGGMPEIPGPPRLPAFEPLPDYGPELPDWRPEPSPYAPTDVPPPLPLEPVTSSRAPTEPVTPSRAPTELAVTQPEAGVPASMAAAAPRPARRITDTEGTPSAAADRAAPPAEGSASAPAPTTATPRADPVQQSFPRFDEPSPGRRALTPDEVAPPDAHSAWLRSERARAEGRPPPGPSRRANNVARHRVPGESSFNTTEPRPDLYQHTPRRSHHESHHVESQTALRENIANYDPARDPTVMMRDTEHHETFAAQAEQRADPNYERALGTPEALEQAYNIARFGEVDAPSPGSNPTRLMSDEVAGQVVMEHAAYLFETTANSRDAGPAGRPIASDDPRVRTGGGIDPFENIDWARTFDQPEPHALAQPAGTQLDLFGNHSRPTPPLPEQLTLPLPEPANPNQMHLPSVNRGEPAAPRPVTETPSPADPSSTRSTRPLTPEEFAAHARTLSESMGVPPDHIRPGEFTAFHPGATPQDGYITIGPDVNPLPPAERPAGLANPANAALEAQGVLAHEAIGHREAELAGQVRDAPWHEEFQASTRAALLDPNLTPQQRQLLMQDAQARRSHAPNDDTIFVWTGRHGAPEAPTAAHAPRPAGHFRPQDQQPSVIVNWERQGMAPPAAATPRGAPRRGAAPPVMSTGPSIGALTAGATAARSASSDRARPDATMAGSARFSNMRRTTTPTAGGAPRSNATRRSAGFARVARDAAFSTPELRMANAARAAYFSAGSRDERVARGSRVGGVAGAVLGGPAGAYLGAAVGAGVARRAEDFNAGLERGSEPIVEPVNPAYPPPPGNGTRQEIVDMQNRLLDILAARAQAEALQGAMAADAAHHEANSGPLDELNQRTGETVTAAQAHQQATAQRQAANQRQQAEEANVGSTLSNYGERAAGLIAITGPLEAFTQFTSLAHILPDSPAVLVGAKRGILRMNNDGQQFLNALRGVDGSVAEQQAATPARDGEIEANAGRIEATAAGNTAAQGQLAQSQSGGQALAARNQARAADSRQREGQALQTGAQLEMQAENTQIGITDLTAQWQAWAQAHAQARADAIAQTRAAMAARGWRPREENTGVAT